MTKSLGRTVAIPGLALGLIVAVIWVAVQDSVRSEEMAARAAHTVDVRTSLLLLLSRLQDIDVAEQDFVVTGDPASIGSLSTALGGAVTQLHAVRGLTTDNSIQQSRCDVLERLIARRVADVQADIALRRTAGFDAAMPQTAKGALVDQIRSEVAGMDQEEQRLLGQLTDAARTGVRRARSFEMIGLGLSTVLLVWAYGVALRENRLRRHVQGELERFFTLPLDLLCVAGVDGYFKRLNPAFSKTLGYTTEELMARPFLDFVHPDDREATMAEVVKLSEGAPTVSFENRYQCKDGSWRWLSWKTQPVAEKGLLYAAARDITTRKGTDAHIAQLLADLRASSSQLAQFKAAIDEHSLVAITDPKGRITYANDKFCTTSKYTREELIGQDHRLVKSGYHPPEFVRDLWETIERGQVWKGDMKNRAKDGTFYWVATTIVPFVDDHGKPIQYIAVRTDITARKKVEAELEDSRAVVENLFRSLPGAFLVLTPSLRIVGASDAYLAATMTTREGLFGHALFEVFPDNPDDPAAAGVENLRASLDRVRQTGTVDTMAIQKYDVRRPDGVFEERYWSPVNAPVFGTQRQLQYIIHRVEDVTEFVRQNGPRDEGPDLLSRVQRMEAEVYRSSQRLQASNRQLELANRELESFSYSVSHDLRAPLRHVQGYVDMLGRATVGQLSERAQRYLETITSASVEMGRLIDDLLSFSRMVRTELQESQVDLAVLVQETIRGLDATPRDRTVVWQVEKLPTVIGDPSMLRQVVINLLDNAAKYSRHRDPARIEIGSSGYENGQVVVFVRDNGAGFDMQYAHKLFGVFQRLHRAEEFEGTGIGLASVRRIVARHGGRVWAESVLGQGATFYFTLQPSTTAAATATGGAHHASFTADPAC